MPTTSGLRSILARFPEQAARIRVLALRRADFRAICEDYDLATQALARFEAEGGEPPRAEVTEYRALIGEIERELLAALEEAEVARPRGADGEPRAPARDPDV